MIVPRQLIAEYRYHASRARRMVALRNQKFVAAGCKPTGEPVWSGRSLDIYVQHADRMRVISRMLRKDGRDEIAEALDVEASTCSAIAWSEMKLAAGLGGEVEPRLTEQLARAREVLTAATKAID